MMTAMSELRARTAHAHARVDESFGAYNLADQGQYTEMLLAHARALPVVERLIIDNYDLPSIRPRTPLLAADLTMLKQSMPATLAFRGASDGPSGWGILYVVEGSRLGGAILAGRVGAGLPSTYLGDSNGSGEWRRLGAAINCEAREHDGAWLTKAVLAAEACFDLYRGASSKISEAAVDPSACVRFRSPSA